MFKSKALVIVAVLVLALAVVAMSCAPASKPATPPATTPAAPATPTTPTPPMPPAPPSTPAAPAAPTAPAAAPAPVIKTSFEATTYTNDNPAFTFMYPKAWTTATTKIMGVVVYAKSTGKDNVFAVVRPATDFDAAGKQFVADMIAASGAAFNPSVDAEDQITLADGTKATQIQLSAAFGMAKATVTGFIKGGNAIMIVCASDPKNMDLYKEIGSTLLVK